MYLCNSNRFLIAGKKEQIIRSAYYLITADESVLTKKSLGYLGKLRSNLSQTQFNLFGPGENPNKGLPPEQTRNQFAGIIYKDQLPFSQLEIKITTLIPILADKKRFAVWKPMNVKIYILLGKPTYDSSFQK